MLRLKKLMLVLMSVLVIFSAFSVSAVSAAGVPGVDYTTGEVIVKIIDGVRISKEELQHPDDIFPGVEILQIRDMTDFSDLPIVVNPPNIGQSLLLVLAADSLKSMQEAIVILEQNPYVKYVSINILVQTIDKEPYQPIALHVVFSDDIDGIVVTVGMEKSQYYLEETIRVKAMVWNNTDKPVTIYSPDTSMLFFNVGISKTDSSIERLINTKTFGYNYATVMIPRTIEPGEEYSQIFEFETWCCPLGRLEPAAPGIYSVKAGLTGSRNPIEFQIEVKSEEEIPTRLTEQDAFIYGDFTGNGRVDGTDILWIQRYIASGRSITTMLQNYPTTITTFCEQAGDFTNNGRVDGTDILWIERYIASGRNVAEMLRNYPTTIDFSHI